MTNYPKVCRDAKYVSWEICDNNRGSTYYWTQSRYRCECGGC
jgi:hypothetical protein